jgi:hypothetical protein
MALTAFLLKLFICFAVGFLLGYHIQIFLGVFCRGKDH